MPEQSQFPRLGANVPQRGFSYSRPFWKKVVQVQGWTVIGEVPNIPKAVLIGAPHTSNFDAVIGVQVLVALGLELHIMAKSELYRPPFRPLLDWIKMIPVDRRSAQGLVDQMRDVFHKRAKFWLGIAPEGTRDSAETWKSGFYRIACAVNVPIVMVGFDYSNKAVIFLGVFEPTGDFDADLPKILAFYKGLKGGNPDQLSLPLRNL